jgi:hypothetical protein
MARSNRQNQPRNRQRPYAKLPEPPRTPKPPKPPGPPKLPDPGCGTGPDPRKILKRISRKK